jgi:hypothetical protein
MKFIFSKSKSVIQKSLIWFNSINTATAALLIFFLFSAASILTINQFYVDCDMAEYLNNAYRVVYGELPYRDFWLLFTPGEVFFPALIYKIFGVNIDILRVATIIASCFTIFLVFITGKNMELSNSRSALLSFIFFFTSVIYHYEGPHYISLFLTFIVLALLFFIKFNNSGKVYFIFLSGLAAGAAVCFRFYESAAATAAFFSSLVIYSVLDKDFKTLLKKIILFIGGWIIFPLVVSLALIDILPRMLHEVIFESVSNGTSMNLPYFYNVFSAWESITRDIAKISVGNYSAYLRLPFHFLYVLYSLSYYLLPAIALIVFIRFFIVNKDKNYRNYIIAIFLLGLFLFPKGLGRSDFAHISLAAAFFAWFIYIVGAIWKKTPKQIYSQNDRINGILKKVINITIILLCFSFVILCVKYASVLINPLYYVKAPNGTVHFTKTEDAASFQEAIDLIEKYTNKNDYIFVTYWGAPPIYALTERRNPTYYDSMNDPIVRPSIEKQQSIIDDLEKSQTKLILDNTGWGYDEKPELQYINACPLLNKYIISNYKLMAVNSHYEIWVR